VDRYDKRFCTGVTDARRPGHVARISNPFHVSTDWEIRATKSSRKQRKPRAKGSDPFFGPTMDLAHYAPGNRFVTFRVKGVTCGVLICYDYRFPELYRHYQRLGVNVLLQSFHNARRSVVPDRQYNIWKTIVPATMACRSAENHFWVSANNSTTKPSCWASFAVRPDGQIVGRLKLHKPGVLVTDMVLDPSFFDAPGPWREAAMNGQLHSGTLVDDPRSADVTCL
jgi:hypothetical protein